MTRPAQGTARGGQRGLGSRARAKARAERGPGRQTSAADRLRGDRVCVVIPCLNERPTVGKVVADFRRVLPNARIIVGDNGSVDGSAELARRTGAEVIVEPRRGKGYVVHALFREAEADVVVLVDADDTYPAEAAAGLIAPVLRGEADMVIGSRIMDGGSGRFRPVNLIGNFLYREVINAVFRTRLTDVLTGYRAMSRALIEGLPLFLGGFEIEAEMTIKALERGYRLLDVPVVLGERPPGSHSKIEVVSDGFRILGTILGLVRDYKPLTFFGSLGVILALAGLVTVGAASLRQPAAEQVVWLACLVSFLVFGGVLLTSVGLVLHTIDRRFQEVEHLLRVGRGPVVGGRRKGGGA